jgi:hypothetical protein
MYFSAPKNPISGIFPFPQKNGNRRPARRFSKPWALKDADPAI